MDEKYNTFIFKNYELSQSNLKNIIDIIGKSKICIIDLKYYDSIIRQQILSIAYLLGTFIIDEDSVFDLEFLISNEEYLNRLVIKKQRNIYRKNSMCSIGFSNYINLEDYLSDLFQVNIYHQPDISCIISTIRKQNINNVLKMLRNQEFVEIEAIIMTHGFELSEHEIKIFQPRYPNLEMKFKYCANQMKLGECLNLGVASAEYSYIAKIDDDDIYSSNYLEDSYYNLMYSGTDVVGKGAHFLYLKNLDIIIKREKNNTLKYSHVVMGATIFGHKNIFKETPFPSLNKSEDTIFLKRIDEQDKVIFQTTPFEYCVVRENEYHHTWKISYKELMKGSKVIGYGNPFYFINT